MTKDEALKLALEALQNPWKAGPDGVADAIIAIKEALAQPEQDGKCKYCTDGCPACDASKLPEQKSVAMADYMALTEKYVALKAAQRTWVGLTHEEAAECWTYNSRTSWKNIEAKLKEKNT